MEENVPVGASINGTAKSFSQGGRLQVLIIGCGLGGLSCAIACAKNGLDVLILEKAKELTTLGAGIQLPPNATRIVSGYFGLLDKCIEAGAVKLDLYNALDYRTGKLLATRPGPEWAEKWFGYPWWVLLRADYQRVLVDEAVKLGVKMRLDCGVEKVECREDRPYVLLADGEKLEADVIIGADGIMSTVRSQVLGYQKDPEPTGDMGYRATIPREQLEALNDPNLDSVLNKSESRIWWGPDVHAILYPVSSGQVFNIALLVPSDLPPGIRKLPADIEQMRALFSDWDPQLNALISSTSNVYRWSLNHMAELDTWVRGSVALLGDACHPTLPYQAQGAAMAVEDGATLGKLLGLLQEATSSESIVSTSDGEAVSKVPLPTKHLRPALPAVLKLYEELRKKRTTLNVAGAKENRVLYHLHEPEAKKRDEQLKDLDWDKEENGCPWLWGDMGYMRYLNGFDTLKEAETAFSEKFVDRQQGRTLPSKALEEKLLKRVESMTF